MVYTFVSNVCYYLAKPNEAESTWTGEKLHDGLFIVVCVHGV